AQKQPRPTNCRSRLEDLRSVCNAWFGLLRLKSLKTEFQIQDSKFQIHRQCPQLQASNLPNARFLISKVWNLESGILNPKFHRQFLSGSWTQTTMASAMQRGGERFCLSTPVQQLRRSRPRLP